MLLSAFCLVLALGTANAEPVVGSVVLDEVTFHKIVSLHSLVLVKFDQMYPWGDHVSHYRTLVSRLSRRDDLLLAEVPVADFGERQNAALAQSFGVKTATYDYPQYRLFIKEKGMKPVVYKGNNEVDDLMKFIILSSGRWLHLPGCVADFDDLIDGFAEKSVEERETLVASAESMLKSIENEADEESGKIYLKVMKRLSAVDGGSDARRALLEDDMKRTNKIMTLERLRPEKLQFLGRRMNILGSFIFNALSKPVARLEDDDLIIGVDDAGGAARAASDSGATETINDDNIDEDDMDDEGIGGYKEEL